ncbi:MAG: hypothetical protein V4484_23295 [Pseudomonadota bacterium]
MGTITTPARPLLRFYFAMAIVITLVVLYGFSRTIEHGLLHPPSPVPAILFVHTFIFSAWMLLLMVQTALVQGRQVRLHRALGMASIVLGVLLPIVGVATALTMARFRIAHGDTGVLSFLMVPLFDMTLFALLFGLGIAWRKRPELHKRLMFMAAAALTVAAFARFPHYLIPAGKFDLAFDALIVIAMLRDYWVEQRVHRVFLIALPLIVAGQLLSNWVRNTPWWIEQAARLLAQ